MSKDDIDCRICEKRHHMDRCPMVKVKQEMILVFCERCGCYYTDGCPNHADAVRVDNK